MFRYTILALLLAGMFLVGCSEDKTSTPTPTLTAPTGLTASLSNSPRSINLAWTDNSRNEAGFKVERRTGEDVTWTLIATLDPNADTYADTDIAEGTVYAYRVFAYLKSTNSSVAGPAIVATWINAPSGFNATRLSTSSIALRWRNNSTAATGFVIERRYGSEPYTQVATPAATDTTYNDINLFTNVTFIYHIKAVKDSLASNWSNTAQATTADLTPGTPTTLHCTSSIGVPYVVQLRWEKHSDNEDGFQIDTMCFGGWGQYGIGRAGSTVYNVNGLTTEKVYTFRVRANNAEYGNSGYSNEATGLVYGKPNGATNLTSVIDTTNGDVVLSWTDNSQMESAFRVERRDVNHAAIFTSLGDVPADVTTFADDRGKGDSTYAYHIITWNTVDRADSISNETRITLPPSPPAPPSNLIAQARVFGRVSISWQDNSPDETGFFLYRADSTNGNWRWTNIAVLAPNATFYSDTLVEPGTRYQYRCRTRNQHGFSNYSNVSPVLTLPMLIFGDDFERYAPGGAPGGTWSAGNHGSTSVTVSRTRSHTGGQSVNFHDPQPDPDANNPNFCTLDYQHEALRQGQLTFYALLPENGYFGLRGYAPDGSTLTYMIQFNPGGVWLGRDDQSIVQPTSTWWTNQWFKVDVVFNIDSSRYRVFFDDSLAADLNIGTSTLACRFIRFMTFSGAELDDGYIDDVKLEHYVPAEGSPRPIDPSSFGGYESPIILDRNHVGPFRPTR